jgi:predicted DCC family thiol-disulfide oxidoreductase YuxK
MPRDRRPTFRFAPLQGETAREYLSAEEISALKTVVLVDETGSYRQSTAVLRVLRRLGGSWPAVAAVLSVIPTPLRDIGYRLVAQNRYRFFGKKEACRMPTAEERERFLP